MAMQTLFSQNHVEGFRPQALQIIPPLNARQDFAALEAAMQSLVLDQQHPVALELAGTAERRCFIVRATTQTALDHAESLLRTQYPQLETRPLAEQDDPFRLEAHEAVSSIELEAGGAAYLPLQTWQEGKKPAEETIDPLLGLLAALTRLPEHTRAIAQLALVPADTNWSRENLRKAVEHSLEPERRTERQTEQIERANRDGFATPLIIGVGVLIGLVTLVRPWLPDWLWTALLRLVTGQNPDLSPLQLLSLAAGVVVLLLIVMLLLFSVEWVRHRFNPNPIYDMRMVARKTMRAAMHVRLRLYVIGPKTRGEASKLSSLAQSKGLRKASASSWDRVRAERELEEIRQETLLRLVAAYRQFHQAGGDYFVPRRIPAKRAQHLFSYDARRRYFGWQQGINRSNHLIGVDALAALWHLPSTEVLPELALVEHRRARTLLMSPDLAQLSAGLPPIGYSEHGGYRLPFALTSQFFTMHTLITGKSGEGKSTCMEHIAREAMTQGGLVLIDPHGDLCEHVLNVVPPSRADDVVIIDLADPAASVGMNVLDVTLGRGRDKAISDLLKTLAHIWVSAWGPRMENAFEMSLRTLFEANKLLVAQDPQNGPRQQYTLLDVLPLLTNENFCHALLQQIDDDYLHRWWREYYEPLTLMQQRDVINPVITKVAKFESIIARRIMGQSVATVNFSQLIAERKILLFKLAKGIVGADVAALLGATMLGLIQITLEEQGAKSLEDRVRFPIILDEFQVLAGVDYAALAELRKYGASFILATQSLEYLQKLDPLLLPTVLANVKQLMIFHMSAQDSETLHKELGVEPEDLLNLDMYTCYVKLASGTRRQPTFSLQILPPPEGDAIQAESIRTRCRVRYTCSVDVVDEMLREAMLRSIRMTPGSSAPASFSSPQTTTNGSHNGNSQNNSHKNGSRGSGSKQPQSASYVPVAPAPPEPDLTIAETEENAPTEESQRKKNRGRRSRERAERYRQEKLKKQGEATPMAFSEDDDDDEVELHEIGRRNDGRKHNDSE